VQSGELDFQAMRAESQKIYESAGVDARIAGACRMRDRQRAAVTRLPRRTPGGAQSAQQSGQQGGRGDRGFVPGGGSGVSTPVQAGEFPARRPRPSLVFIAENGTYTPRVVRLGVGNFDYTEVVSGLKEGEQVALLAAAAMQAKREEQNNRMRGMGGLPASRRNGQAAERGRCGGGVVVVRLAAGLRAVRPDPNERSPCSLARSSPSRSARSERTSCGRCSRCSAS
jgi:hypothetical protein